MTYDEIIAKSTPRPWKLGKEFSCHTEIKAGDFILAKTSCHHDIDRHSDAAYIVLAVNAHQAMYKALGELTANYMDAGYCGFCGSIGWHGTECPVGKGISALALARGEK